jgi:hypothetical protein
MLLHLKAHNWTANGVTHLAAYEPFLKSFLRASKFRAGFVAATDGG